MTTSKNTVDYSTVPQGVVSEDVLKEKYLKGEETKIEEVFARVAREMASVEKPEDQKRVEEMFYQNMLDGAIGAGRIMSSGGTDIKATLINCFSGETQALTKDNGFVALRDLVGQEQEVMTIGGWRPAAFKNFGIDRLMKITLENGKEIFSTFNHRWLVTKSSGYTNVQRLEEVLTVNLQGYYIPHLVDGRFIDSSKVTTVEYTERVEDVFCAVEPETQTFVIEGNLLTRNCFVQPVGELDRALRQRRSAWHAGLKGLATYRPNDILGAVLVANEEKKEAPKKEEAEPIKESVDYMRTPIDKRPHGALPAVVEKIQFMAGGQLYRYYLTVGFLPLGEGDEKVLRPIEFFLKSIEGDNDTHWIEAAMRGLSLSARAGELDRALRDMKKVRWTNGPIRFGETLHADGYNVPKFHTSPVAVLAYAIEQHIQNKAVPANLAEKQKGADPEQKAPANMVEAGRECHECGAHAVVRRDGCEKCTNCGMLGSCG